jgi:hypothetical protein
MNGKILWMLLLMAVPFLAAPQVSMMGILSPATVADLLVLWFGIGFLAFAIITPGLIADKNNGRCETEEGD